MSGSYRARQYRKQRLQLQMHDTDVLQESTRLKLLQAAVAAKVSGVHHDAVAGSSRRRGAVTSGLRGKAGFLPFADVPRSLVLLELGPLGCLEVAQLAEVAFQLNERLESVATFFLLSLSKTVSSTQTIGCFL